MEEERDPGGGEEFGVSGALVGGEEHVGVHRVERCSDESRGGGGEIAGQIVCGDTCCRKREPGVEDRSPCPREDEAESGADGPCKWRVEDEAGLACVPCGGVGPVGVQVAVGELAGGLHPTEDVEVEVVAAGAAVYQKRNDGDERGYRG